MCHGLAAYWLGDRTAKAMGRLSLNPLRHLDPVGALCLLFFGFGWAKPVMINTAYFKKPKRDMSLTALAGPVSNFLFAYVALLILKLLSITFLPGGTIGRAVVMFLSALVSMNVGLGVFNLIPIPPLDGSKIFLSLLPSRLYYDIMRYEHLGWLVLVVALSLGVLDPVLGTLRLLITNLMILLVGGL
ncbi:MAG: site-2 protease family protein [Ruminococcaceae bacterium]|nr:site-2 protease family protein [Oscillospiraceae bacterium]